MGQSNCRAELPLQRDTLVFFLCPSSYSPRMFTWDHVTRSRFPSTSECEPEPHRNAQGSVRSASHCGPIDRLRSARRTSGSRRRACGGRVSWQSAALKEEEQHNLGRAELAMVLAAGWPAESMVAHPRPFIPLARGGRTTPRCPGKHEQTLCKRLSSPISAALNFCFVSYFFSR